MTTIADAVEIAEQTGLADRIRLNDQIVESELACHDFFQAVEGDKLYTAEREKTAELEARLHASEQTILRLLTRVTVLEDALRPFAAVAQCFKSGDVERGYSIHWYQHTDRCQPVFNLKPANFVVAQTALGECNNG